MVKTVTGGVPDHQSRRAHFLNTPPVFLGKENLGCHVISDGAGVGDVRGGRGGGRNSSGTHSGSTRDSTSTFNSPSPYSTFKPRHQRSRPSTCSSLALVGRHTRVCDASFDKPSSTPKEDASNDHRSKRGGPFLRRRDVQIKKMTLPSRPIAYGMDGHTITTVPSDASLAPLAGNSDRELKNSRSMR